MNYKKRIKKLEKRIAKLESAAHIKAVQRIGTPQPISEDTPQSLKAK